MTEIKTKPITYTTQTWSTGTGPDREAIHVTWEALAEVGLVGDGSDDDKIEAALRVSGADLGKFYDGATDEGGWIWITDRITGACCAVKGRADASAL